MESDENKYVCIREKQVNKHEVDIAELKTRVEYKHQAIDEMKDTINKLDEKLDKIDNCLSELRLQSERDDFDIDSRVTRLETAQNTMKWIIGIGLTAISTAVGVLTFILTHIH